MQDKHTPGPWNGTYNNDGVPIVVGPFGGGTVAEIHSDEMETIEADLRLIAAAPDMLDALRGALDALVAVGESCEDEIEEVRTALFLASGTGRGRHAIAALAVRKPKA